jgi:hypothetical protein
MGAYKELFTEMQDEMFNVAKLLSNAAEDGDPEVVFDAMIEGTARLAVVTRRYKSLWTPS